MNASPLTQLRLKAQAQGIDEAICANCGRFREGAGDMGICRQRNEQQFRFGICLDWSLSTIVSVKPSPVIEPDGTRRLFAGAVPPVEAEEPPGAVEGLKCAEDGCGGTLELRYSEKLGKRFYGCSRYPKCSGVLPAKDDGTPVGIPRTRELQGWRRRAHDAFDCLWRDGHCSRRDAYSWLRSAMGLSSEKAHMFQMTAEQCEQVIEFVKTKGPGTEFWQQWLTERAARKPEKRRRRGGRRKDRRA